MSDYDVNHTFIVEVSEEVSDEPHGYIINGQLKPIIYVIIGEKYVFKIDTQGHPFAITTSTLGGNGGEGIEEGVLHFTCTEDHFETQHYYQCTLHPQMGYKIIALRS